MNEKLPAQQRALEIRNALLEIFSYTRVDISLYANKGIKNSVKKTLKRSQSRPEKRLKLMLALFVPAVFIGLTLTSAPGYSNSLGNFLLGSVGMIALSFIGMGAIAAFADWTKRDLEDDQVNNFRGFICGTLFLLIASLFNPFWGILGASTLVLLYSLVTSVAMWIEDRIEPFHPFRSHLESLKREAFKKMNARKRVLLKKDENPDFFVNHFASMLGCSFKEKQEAIEALQEEMKRLDRARRVFKSAILFILKEMSSRITYSVVSEEECLMNNQAVRELVELYCLTYRCMLSATKISPKHQWSLEVEEINSRISWLKDQKIAA